MTQSTRGLIAFIALFLLVMTLTLLGHATTTEKHSNGLGIVMQQTNPNTYIEGAVIGAAVIETAVNLRVQPRNTYNLFTQDILMCDQGHVVALFEGKGNPVTLTYETVAHHTIQGVGCHELRAVDEIKTTPLP